MSASHTLNAPRYKLQLEEASIYLRPVFFLSPNHLSYNMIVEQGQVTYPEEVAIL